MKPDFILSATIILALIGMTWTIRYTVMQPIEPICEKEGSPIPCDIVEKGQEP